MHKVIAKIEIFLEQHGKRCWKTLCLLLKIKESRLLDGVRYTMMSWTMFPLGNTNYWAICITESLKEEVICTPWMLVRWGKLSSEISLWLTGQPTERFSPSKGPVIGLWILEPTNASFQVSLPLCRTLWRPMGTLQRKPIYWNKVAYASYQHK